MAPEHGTNGMKRQENPNSILGRPLTSPVSQEPLGILQQPPGNALARQRAAPTPCPSYTLLELPGTQTANPPQRWNASAEGRAE